MKTPMVNQIYRTQYVCECIRECADTVLCGFEMGEAFPWKMELIEEMEALREHAKRVERRAWELVKPR